MWSNLPAPRHMKVSKMTNRTKGTELLNESEILWATQELFVTVLEIFVSGLLIVCIKVLRNGLINLILLAEPNPGFQGAFLRVRIPVL